MGAEFCFCQYLKTVFWPWLTSYRINFLPKDIKYMSDCATF